MGKGKDGCAQDQRAARNYDAESLGMVQTEGAALTEAEPPTTDRAALLEFLSEEELQRLEKMTWREPSVADFAFAEQTARELDIHLVTALRLEKENFTGVDYSQHRAFLHPEAGQIADPEDTVEGMGEAAGYLLERLQAGDKVAIFADYDVDGTTAARVAQLALQRAGAQQDQAIWGYASATDGFGLTQKFVTQAHRQGASTLITLDCGSTQSEAIAYAQSLGMKVIVIDHHDVDPDNPADFHLNPRFRHELRKRELEDLAAQAEQLLEEATQAKEAALAEPDNAEAQAALEQYVQRSREMIAQLDGESDAPYPSGRLQVAIERVRTQASDLQVQSTNTGAQLSWKFGAALQQQQEGAIDPGWYGQPLYLAGTGALGDMADTRELENRAFIRVPVANPEQIPVPAGMRLLAEHFEEDPAVPAGMIRTRAAMNLAKRTSRVQAEHVVAVLAAEDEQKAQQAAQALLEQYQQATEVRDRMLEEAKSDWERRCKAATKKNGREPYWTHAVIEGYPEDVGQSGAIATRLTRPYQRPAVIFTQRGPDADGEMVYKFSARNNVVRKVKIGAIRDDAKLREACTIAQADEHGQVEHSPSLGGHDDVVSGACRADQVNAVIERFEHFASAIDNRDPRYGWYVRPRTSVWLTKRLVPAADLPRLEQEAQLLRPTDSSFNYPMRISTTARVRDIGELDQVVGTYPATLELPDGSTRPCSVAQESLAAMSSGTWLEIALSLGEKRYWVRDCRPLPGS